jgi:hypothetical protein
MSAARGERWGVGRQARRRGRLLGSLSGTIPWSELEHMGARGGRRAARSPHAHPPPEGAGPVIPPLVRQWPDAATAEPRVAAWEQQLRALPRRVRRALQRHFVLSLAELALILALWQGPAWTATIDVDGTTCTLAAAITAANTDTATSGCPAGSGADTLVLPVGETITLTTTADTTDGNTGLPLVTSVITIAGQGSTLERDPGAVDFFRLLAVGSGGNLTVQALTLQGGNTASYGGGLRNNFGSVTIVNSTLSGNTAGDDGSGVSNFNGSLTIVNSTLSGNTAAGDGGGVSNHTGSVTIANSTLSGNASILGGGVFNDSTLTLSQSALSGNTSSGSGGGVANVAAAGTASLTLANCTFSGNTAFTGGGVANMLTSGTASLTITHCTLTGNFAIDLANGGGGVYNSGSLTLAHALIAGNSMALSTSARELANVGAGTVTADNSNLFGYSDVSGVSGFTVSGSDFTPSVALAAILAPSLTFNGGPTPTHDLVVGSPAIDNATTGTCPAADQRSFVRPSGAGCDIGAVEAAASLPPEVTSAVDFAALATSFSTTTDTTGCGGGAGKFSFLAQLTNEDGALSLLKAQVAELSGGNLLQTADEAPGGPGALQTLPEVGDFSDGVLEPAGTVTVPFVICLQSVTPFRFTVDLLGTGALP